MMVRIKGFRGFGYSVNPLDDYITLPYDEIGMAMRKKYLERNTYNFSRIILPPEGEDPLQTINFLISRKILKQDEKETIYVYNQKFSLGGKSYKRKGYLGLVPLNTMNVLPHEKIFEEPKKNRLEMLLRTGFDLEPIFLLYRNNGKNCFHLEEEELISWGEHPDGFMNIIYKSKTNELECDGVKFVIADGHHRFAAALEYSKIIKNAEMIMAFFLDVEQDSVMILPSNKIVRNVNIDLKNFQDFFDMEEMETMDNFQKKNIIMRYKGKFYNLYLKENLKLTLPQVFEKIIMEKILNKKIEMENVETFHDFHIDEKMKNSAIFYIPPPTPLEVYEFAINGNIMPQKSTYFFPKIASGIKMYKKI